MEPPDELGRIDPVGSVENEPEIVDPPDPIDEEDPLLSLKPWPGLIVLFEVPFNIADEILPFESSACKKNELCILF
jgi:hypothetical protein